MARRRSGEPEPDYDKLETDAEIDKLTGTETAKQITDRGIGLYNLLEKLHRQHLVYTIITILLVAVSILQSYAVATILWVEDPLAVTAHGRSRINRSAFWRMFLLPWVNVFALIYAKHLFHDNLSSKLSTGRRILMVWVGLYTLWGIWLAAEAFWWCSGHMYDYCTDTATTELTTSYWIFIGATWGGVAINIWNWFVLGDTAKHISSALTLRRGLSDAELMSQLSAAMLGNGRYVHGIGQMLGERY